ncbi:MAG TPA: Pvc16 family protein [Kofleriaceae bacterium]
MTELLREHLRARIDPGEMTNVSIGRPDLGSTNPRVNLFLYEANLDATMRSLAVDAGRPPPLWLALRFLVTAHDDTGESETPQALRLIGSALRVVHELGYLRLIPLPLGEDAIALQGNPEPLKISLLDAGSELLGRLMQGSDEKYRFAMAFEVRPVMIATRETNEDALLVGLRYRTPTTEDPEPGVNLVVEPEVTPPTLNRIVSANAASATVTVADVLEPGAVPSGAREVIQLFGSGIRPGDTPLLGGVELPAITRAGDSLVTSLDVATMLDGKITAGIYTFVVREVLVPPRRRQRVTSPLLVRLRPTVTAVNVLDTSADDLGPGDAGVRIRLEILGELLGGPDDDVIISLWAGTTVASSDELAPIDPLDTSQRRREVTLHRVPLPIKYRAIVRVNGVQARSSPIVEVAP